MIKYIVYRTTDVSTGEYYIGLHKLNVLKPKNYWGSFWGHWQPNKANLVRETLAEYPDRESSRQAEPLWIEPHLVDPLCKNRHAEELPKRFDRCDKPGNKSMLGKKHTPEAIEKNRQSHLGKTISAETRAKHSLAISGENNHMWGKTHTQEARAKISESQKGENHRMWGKTHTDETRAKISLAKKGKPGTKVECPNCYKLVDPGNAKRWHFDNCKKLK